MGYRGKTCNIPRNIRLNIMEYKNIKIEYLKKYVTRIFSTFLKYEIFRILPKCIITFEIQYSFGFNRILKKIVC